MEKNNDTHFLISKSGQSQFNANSTSIYNYKVVEGEDPAQILYSTYKDRTDIDKNEIINIILKQYVSSHVEYRSPDAILVAADQAQFSLAPRIGYRLGYHRGSHGGFTSDEMLSFVLDFNFEPKRKIQSIVRSANIKEIIGL